jgi:uncharacterized protein YecE (DUF72 family)
MKRRRAAPARSRQPALRIGISGWNYPPWRQVFYPKGLAQRRELEYASRQFNSVEINGTFYSLQRPDYFRRWYEQTPADFRFAVKGSRFITHLRKLRDIRIPLANFFASGPLALNEKLGPILWQFGPNWGLDLARFEEFLEMLPRTTQDAARLARRHDERVADQAWTRTDADRPLRYAIEPRHPSYFTPPFVRLLRRQRVALVFADTADTFPYAEDVTADFLYVRLHGTGQLHVGGYSDAQLDGWAKRIRAWSTGREPADARRIADRPAPARARRDAYVYFDNDAKVKAPFNALCLAEKLGLPPGPEADPAHAGGAHAVDVPTPPLSPTETESRRIEAGLRWPFRPGTRE